MATSHDGYDECGDDFDGMSRDELAGVVVLGRRRRSALEQSWLAALAAFDRRGGWAADGALSCADWLMARAKLARSTAHDKLRVAHELQRRPLVSAAFATGELSWCQVRAITRITDLDESVDRALLDVARAGTVADLELAVRHWRLIADQDRPPPDAPHRRRCLHRKRLGDGLSRIVIDLPEEDADLVEASLRAVMARAGTTRSEPGDESSCEDTPAPRQATAGAGDESSCEDTGGGVEPIESPEPPASYPQKRADAFLDLVLLGRANLDLTDLTGGDHFTVNVLVDYDRIVGAAPTTGELVGGEPLTNEALRRICCDAGVVRQVMKGKSEVLDMGRRVRTFTRAQRRALRGVFGGRCSFPGCWRHLVQVHHLEHWTGGGPTDLANGAPACWAHHRLVHEGGWSTVGNPLDGTLAFVDPQGRVHPAQYPVRLELPFDTAA